MEDDAKPPPPEPGEGTKSSGVPADATCWICLDGGDLQRSCACRGPSAGYAHVDCIASYARAKLADVLSSGPTTSKRGVAGLASYTTCPACNKWYTGKMLQRLTTDLAHALGHLPMSNHARITAVFIKARAHAVSKPEIAANEYRSLLVEENDFHELTMKAMVFLVLIEFRTGNAESIAEQLNETNAFYDTHRQYFERRGLGREKFGLLGTLDDMLFNTSEETANWAYEMARNILSGDAEAGGYSDTAGLKASVALFIFMAYACTQDFAATAIKATSIFWGFWGLLSYVAPEIAKKPWRFADTSERSNINVQEFGVFLISTAILSGSLVFCDDMTKTQAWGLAALPWLLNTAKNLVTDGYAEFGVNKNMMIAWLLFHIAVTGTTLF